MHSVKLRFVHKEREEFQPVEVQPNPLVRHLRLSRDTNDLKF